MLTSKKYWKKFHKPLEKKSFSWLKIGNIVKFRSYRKTRSPDEIWLDFGIEYWNEYPPPDIDGNHFGLRGDETKNLFDEPCLITDKRIYKYAIPALTEETLIQVIVKEKIIWV